VGKGQFASRKQITLKELIIVSDLSIVIYESSLCPYCMWAKQLLAEKKLAFTAINIDSDMKKRTEMEKLSGRSSVPQIFFAERHIGGFDDLSALDESGELDQLITT
jgi:glutaredoxin 3